MDGWMIDGLLYCMCNGAPQNTYQIKQIKCILTKFATDKNDNY